MCASRVHLDHKLSKSVSMSRELIPVEFTYVNQ